MAKKILTVDDEPHILELVKAILLNEGYEVLTAESGKEALEVLESETVDLVMLDMMMPGMSGRETCDQIRQNSETKDLKVIFLTVAKFSETGIKALKGMGVLDYITKPFENEDLIKRVKKILD